jgi:hypothetical protein
MMRDWRYPAVRILVISMVASLGCASSAYAPRPSHRTSLIWSEGSAKLTRDSKTFGLWDLDEAVAGNPEAESDARIFRHRTIGGFVLEFPGLGGLLTGAALANSSSRTQQEVGAGVAGGGAVALLAALWLLNSGFAHFYDAINIYNDGLPPEPAR